jgi:hypothetical protein
MNNIRWANDEHIGVCFDQGDIVVYLDGGPVYDDILAGKYGPIGDPVVIVTPATPPTPEQIATLRRQAYQLEADPLFFKAQRGEATEQEWLDKIAEIRARYPEAEA